MSAMASPLLSPSALVALTRYAVGQVVTTAATVATVPVRMMSLLGQAELLTTRITMIADSAETLVERLAALAADADQAVRDTRAIVAAAAVTLRETEVIAATAGRVVAEAEAVAGTAGRLVQEADLVAGAAGRVVHEAESVATEAARVVGGAAAATDAAVALVADAGGITGGASAVVVRAGSIAAEAQDLLDGYSDTLRKAAPLAARFVGELSSEEVTAAIKMVDALPALRAHLVDDVMPLLRKLDQVGPDVHSLLEVTEDLRLAIAGLPGLKMLRRRGEERIEEDAANGR